MQICLYDEYLAKWITGIKDVDSLKTVKILLMFYSMCDPLTHSELCNMLSVTMPWSTTLRVLTHGFQHTDVKKMSILLFMVKTWCENSYSHVGLNIVRGFVLHCGDHFWGIYSPWCLEQFGGHLNVYEPLEVKQHQRCCSVRVRVRDHFPDILGMTAFAKWGS